MSAPQNRGRSGRFPKGISGNPGGRPQGLAKATRELVVDDGMALAQLWWDIAQNPLQRTSDRLEASKLLADRGWGKAAMSREDYVFYDCKDPVQAFVSMVPLDGSAPLPPIRVAPRHGERWLDAISVVLK